jgi:hypothetical protein
MFEHTLSGWWCNNHLEKMMEFISWDDDIPFSMENKSHVPNHQPVIACIWI